MRRITGLHHYRTKNHTEEKAFADEWWKQNEQGKLLAHLLTVGDQGGHPANPSERDQVVAATVMQWLGSHVGECFLRDLGYRKERA